MGITIKKIASDLNLAVSTVSKALNDSHEISQETKQRILEYAREHNFNPNPYAGSIKNKKTRNVAVIVPEVADSFFSNAINGIDMIAQSKGYHVLVYLTHESPEREESILQELSFGRVDGILISTSSGSGRSTQQHEMLAKSIPLIFFDRVIDSVNTAKVLTDDFQSACIATQHLISNGCKKIIFLSLTEDLSIITQRKDGFSKAIMDAALGIPYVVVCDNNEEKSYQAIKEALRADTEIDGIICAVEKLAITAYAVCNDLNVTIPDRVKVIAFSNLQIASLMAPSLTTVMQPAFDMGKAAATLLFSSLEKKIDISKQRVVIPSLLVVRNSSK